MDLRYGGRGIPAGSGDLIPTVPDTLVQLERQCLGLRVPCLDGRHWFCGYGGGGSQHRFVALAHEIDIQYEVIGRGGGTWHLTVRQDEGELRAGASDRPHLTVRVFVEDWLALWAGAESPSTLLGRRRLSVLPEELAVTASLDLPRLGLLGPLREIEYTEWEDVACADGGLCPHAGPGWPPTLNDLNFRLLSPGVSEALSQHNASPEARRLRWLIVMSGLSLLLALGICLAIGIVVGVDSLVGWVAGLWTAATLYWFLKRPIARRLEARCRRSPRAFRWMVEAGLITYLPSWLNFFEALPVRK